MKGWSLPRLRRRTRPHIAQERACAATLFATPSLRPHHQVTHPITYCSFKAPGLPVGLLPIAAARRLDGWLHDGSPQEAFPCWLATSATKSRQVQYRLIRMNISDTCFIDGIRHRCNDRFGPADRIADIGYNEVGDVRNHLHEVAPVGADKLRNFDIRVEYPDLPAFADQPLHQFDERTLSDVVGPGLETDPQKRNALSRSVEDPVYAPIDQHLVAFEDMIENREVEIVLPSQVGECSQVFRQAGATERKAGPQIGGRNVKALVLEKNIHHIVAVNSQCLGNHPDFIAKSDFQCVP